MDYYFKKLLKEFALPEKIEFQKRLVKSEYENLGIPTPQLRKLAKVFSILEIPESDNYLFDELMLYGLSIGYSKQPILDKLGLIDAYLDKVDSWALTDSFCSTIKIKRTEYEPFFDFVLENLNSDSIFHQRFALVIFLAHYIKLDKDLKKLSRLKKLDIEDLQISRKDLSQYFKKILELINKSYSDYYVSMAAAWLLCEMFLVSPKDIYLFLQNNQLDTLTLNRTIDKIIQSKTPNSEVKEIIKKLKRRVD